MSLDCPLAIRYKKGEYIVIGGDIFGYRLYLGDMICIWFWCIYLITGCICKGETLCLCFYAYCFYVFMFLFHIMVHWFWFILWGYSWYMSYILCFVKTRGLFCFTCIIPHVFMFLFSVSRIYKLIQLRLLSTFATDR